MKRTISILLSLVLIMLLVAGSCGSAVAAKRVTKVKTGMQGASLRATPELFDYNKIGGVHANEVLDVLDEQYGWYYVCYFGKYGWINGSPAIVTVVETEEVPDTPAEAPAGSAGEDPGIAPGPRYSYLDPYMMQTPEIGDIAFSADMMNMVIFWAQSQLKATGTWDPGEVSGCLDEGTMTAIRAFMDANGRPGHSGEVDQAVIDTLAAYMGNGLVQVPAGGYYNYMSVLFTVDPYGTMSFVVSNLRDEVEQETVEARWVQIVLRELGYYTGETGGQYGEVTQDAVNRFQRDHGFQERDYVSLGVARAMLEEYHNQEKDLLLLP